MKLIMSFLEHTLLAAGLIAMFVVMLIIVLVEMTLPVLPLAIVAWMIYWMASR